MGKYDRCPNCGNTDNANIYRCNKCGKVFCSACGKVTTNVIKWIVAEFKGRCPVCGSNDVTELGSIGFPLFG